MADCDYSGAACAGDAPSFLHEHTNIQLRHAGAPQAVRGAFDAMQAWKPGL